MGVGDPPGEKFSRGLYQLEFYGTYQGHHANLILRATLCFLRWMKSHSTAKC